MSRLIVTLPVVGLAALGLALGGCEQDSPEETRSFFDEGGGQGTQGAAGMPEGHPTTAGAPGSGRPAGAMGAGGQPAARGATVVRGTITVSDELAAQVPRGGVLYITGRMPPQGDQRGPPILVKRVVAPGYPFPFVLSEENVMMEGMPIPDRLVVEARISQSGDAIARTPGDMEGVTSEPVARGATDVALVLDNLITETRPGMRIGGEGGGLAPQGVPTHPPLGQQVPGHPPLPQQQVPAHPPVQQGGGY
jgi:hypothetical protein